jgi:2-phospho-L-lactate/phosphoenolpyruvate guanylyltransferase
MIWAIVPVKPLLLGKSRLAGAIAPQARATLNRSLLENTLKTLRGARGIDQTLVTSRDPEALAIAREFSARTLLEQSAAHLNGALERATILARAVQCRAVLVLPADLPLLSTDDVQALLALLNGDSIVALAPDRHETGTNALLISPPGSIAFRFGRASFDQHKQQTLQAGIRLEIVRRPSLALDLDLPEDLALLRELRSGGVPDPANHFDLPTEEQPTTGEAT